MKLTLKTPIVLAPGATPITELTMRESVTGADIRAMKVRSFDPDTLTVGDLLGLAERLTGQPTIVFDKMDSADAAEVATAALGFLSGSRGTGKSA